MTEPPPRQAKERSFLTNRRAWANLQTHSSFPNWWSSNFPFSSNLKSYHPYPAVHSWPIPYAIRYARNTGLLAFITSSSTSSHKSKSLPPWRSQGSVRLFKNNPFIGPYLLFAFLTGATSYTESQLPIPISVWGFCRPEAFLVTSKSLHAQHLTRGWRSKYSC